MENLRRDPLCTATVDRKERYSELQGVMLEGRAHVLEDAAAEAADEHLGSVVRDRIGAKYATGGFGSGASAGTTPSSRSAMKPEVVLYGSLSARPCDRRHRSGWPGE